MADVTTVTSEARLHAAFRSDPGRVRTNNEDVPIVDPERGVYGVIDGVGGQAAGEVAAGIACDVILQRLARPLGTPAERVREAIAIANNEIFKRAEESAGLRGMACVVTLAIVTDRLLTIGHVGDSRLYKFRAGGVLKLTHDHSPIGEREDAREISESDAMRHPRRNEVFRDVGSAFRDKDEEAFVEVIEQAVERDCAILLCTDGLTDMVTSTAIEQIVRRHAGNPEEVADALVTAANDAGGKDNVTVVYAEAPEFARAVRGTQDHGGPFDPSRASGSSRAESRDGVAPSRVEGGLAQGAPNRLVRSARRILRSRTTWFAFGALFGVLASLLLAWRVGDTHVFGNRTLVVGAEAIGAFPRISEAMQAARPGDVVRLEPGVYPEGVVVGDGVSLVARVPGTVTIVRPEEAIGVWVGIVALGTLGGHISGIKIESTPQLPIEWGMRVSGQDRTVDLVELTGPMRAGIELLPAAAVTIQGSQLAIQGPALAIGNGAHAIVTGSMFLRTGPPAGPPISIGAAARATLKRNVFAGYGADIVKGVSAAERQQIVSGNYVIGAEPSLLR
jgi:serine/threonine protein phosphatase PrpC